MKKIIKLFIPPILFLIRNKIRKKKYGWFGDYKDWASAKLGVTGYNSDEIFNRVENASLDVKNGNAIYERDSVLYDQIYYSWPLLSGVILSAIKNGNINVLDFGGSLGSTYYQNKKFLDDIEDVSWNIVEQKHFVDIGKQKFEDARLHFYYDIESCLKDNQCNIIILACVLQYIETPYSLLDKIFKFNFEYVLMDRTPFSKKNRDELKIQIVSPVIYDASYPCWLFDKNKLFAHFESNNYTLIEEFDVEDQLDGKSEVYDFKGMIWKKNIE